MIPDLQMSVICDDVRQERNGKFILIGLFDVVNLPSFPGIFGRVCIVNRWCCGQGEFTEQTRIVAPDNGPVAAEGKPITVQLQHPEFTATNVEFFINVKFDKEGVYWVEILLNGHMKLRYPLRVIQVKPPKPSSAEGPTLA